MSVAMAMTSVLLRARRAVTGRATEELVAALRTREYPQPTPAPKAMRERYDVTQDEVDGSVVLRLTPKVGATGQQLLYTHGGWYVYPLSGEQWWFVDRMTRGSGVRLTVPLYRLAPEGGPAAAYEMLRRVYCGLVEAGPVTVAGDSAGGGLALGQAIAYRASGLPAPRQVVLIAPWLDITLSNPAVPALQAVDPMHRAEAVRAYGALWAGDRDPRDPLLSPLFGDLEGLPPVHTFQGGHDLLAADAQELGRRLQRADNPGTFTFAPTAIHDYLGAFWTPEARSALAAVNQLLRE